MGIIKNRIKIEQYVSKVQFCCRSRKGTMEKAIFTLSMILKII